MEQKSASPSLWPRWIGYAVVAGILILVCSFPAYVAGSIGYTETKGPFKNWTQVVDLDEDDDLDVIVSHTRWEDVDISWAGVGRWINQGDCTFELVRDEAMDDFAGFAGGAGDVDQDGGCGCLRRSGQANDGNGRFVGRPDPAQRRDRKAGALRPVAGGYGPHLHRAGRCAR